jgi:thiol-disulfide isomerase/thioredoxin
VRRLTRLTTRASAAGAVVIAFFATAPAATPKSLAKPKPVPIVPADIATIQAAIKEPGASAVLVNVWASWCDPCREEMPDLLRFYRAHRKEGVRLLLVSADDKDDLAAAQAFLREQKVDFETYLKVDKDMPFIAAFDNSWSGALPASFLYDGRGQKRHFWSGKVTRDQLEAKLTELFASQRKDESNTNHQTGRTK